MSRFLERAQWFHDNFSWMERATRSCLRHPLVWAAGMGVSAFVVLWLLLGSWPVPAGLAGAYGLVCAWSFTRGPAHRNMLRFLGDRPSSE